MNTNTFCGVGWRAVVIFWLGIWAGETRGQFVAFDEHAGGAKTSPNATFWTILYGTNKNTGLLRNITNGTATKVTLTVQTNGAPTSSGISGVPTNASPASNVFGAYVTFGNGYYTLGTNQVVTYTLSGLDPNNLYSFKGTTIRGNTNSGLQNFNSNRWTLFELVGADNFTNAHTSGCLTGDSNTFGLTNNQVVLNTGDNRRGDIFDWEWIHPGMDGTVMIRVRKFYGATTSIPSVLYSNDWSAFAYGYGLEVLRVEEIFVPTPPSLSVPLAEVWVGLGGSNGLSTVATGSAPLAYQWYKGNTDNTVSNTLPYATNAVLVLPAASLDDAGYYTVVVTNAFGRAVSRTAQVTVWADAPFFQIQPASARVLVDTTNTFTALALGAWPIAYQWYAGALVPGGTAIAGATNPALTINASESAAGPYYVVASNSLGSMSSMQAWLLLTYDPVGISAQPQDQSVDEGASVTFTVAASGSRPRYQWHFGGTALTGATNTTLTLTNVLVGQSGFYQALAYNPASSNLSRAVALAIRRRTASLVDTNQIWFYNDTGADLGTYWSAVSYPPASAWSNGPALIGFKVDSAGNYLATDINAAAGFQTFRTVMNRTNSFTGTNSTMTYYLRATFTNDGSFTAPGMSLTFSNLIDDGAIIYLNGVEIGRYNMPAGAVNYRTSASRTTNASAWYWFGVPDAMLLPGINVLAAELHQFNNSSSDVDWLCRVAATYALPGPLTITNQPTDAVVPEGRPALFSAGVSNATSVWAEYQWYRVAYSQTQAVVGATSSSLQIPHALAGRDDGAYFLTVSNPLFSTNSRLTALTVAPAPPFLDAAPSNSTVCFGLPAQFQVMAYGTPPLSYQWSCNGRPIPDATNAIYAVTSAATAGEAGLYVVVVSNPLGTVASLPAWLRVVPYEPVFSLEPADVVASVGQTVVFSAEATGCPWPACQWQCNGTNLPDATNAILTLPSVQLAQTGVYRLVASNEAGLTLSHEAHLFLPALDETLNSPGLAWTNQTTATPWLPQNPVTHDGFAALQSTASNATAQSTLLTTAVGPARVSFWWKLQAADAAPKLEFLVDGITQFSLTGAHDWQPAGLFIGSGSHVLSWRFSINNSTNGAVAWLDEVVYDPASLAPVILSLPSALNLPVGAGGTLQVSAIGVSSLHYRWAADGVDLPGPGQAACVIPPALAAGVTAYTVTVSDEYGSTSATTLVTVTNSPPRFWRAASFVRAPVGQDAGLAAPAYGTLPLAFQWWFNGVPLPGETNALLLLRQVQASQAGSYWMVASNSLGTTVGPIIPLLVGGMPHVIHLVVGGLGGTYLTTALSNWPARYPNFLRLVTEGASTMNARCDYTDSSTVPNHVSILTGRPIRQPDGQPITVPHGFTDEYPPAGTIIHTSGNPNVPYKASVLDVAHDHGLQTALVLGRGTLTTCAQSYDATNGAPDLVPPDNGRNKIDHAVVNDDFSSGIVDAFLPMITNATPCNYAFLHFSDANYNGHWYGWGSSNYFDTLQTVDAQLGRILTAIDQTPELAAPGQTALIVTADYGGQDSNHTAAELLPIYTIPIIVWGAGIAPGTDLYTIFANRADPGTNRLDYNAIWQPLRNGDTGNLALTLLGLPSIPGSTMIPMFPTQSPALSVRPTDAGARLEWTTAAAGYTLQTSDRLDSAAVWLPVTQGIVTNANQCIYEITPKAGPRFFRLSRP